MKIKIFSLAIIALVAFSNCRATKNKTSNTDASTQNSATQSSKSEALATDAYRFIASFYSIGGGPDIKAVTKFKDFVAGYSSKINKEIVPQIFNWGREGESDYCYKLTGLNDKEQNEFVLEANKLLSTCQLVHVSENAACTHKR